MHLAWTVVFFELPMGGSYAVLSLNAYMDEDRCPSASIERLPSVHTPGLERNFIDTLQLAVAIFQACPEVSRKNWAQWFRPVALAVGSGETW